MDIESVFENNEAMPGRFTCDGENINPQIEINNIPKEAKSIALIIDDPDAPIGTFVHWVVFNIPVLGNQNIIILENSTPGISGKNGTGKIGYIGPCPPSGTHHYFFKVYALDTLLRLDEGSTKAELEYAMENHLIAKAELIGLYTRK